VRIWWTFIARHYTAAGAVVSIVGDVSRSRGRGHRHPADRRFAVGEAPVQPADATLAVGQTIRVPHPSAQAHIAVGQPGIRRGDPDFFPLVVGNYILGGGGFVSRLTREVREKRGYAYSVYSYFSPQRSAGPFQIGLQTKGSQADDALKVVSETLGTFLKDGPTEGELKAAKENLVNGFALRLDSNRKMLEQVAVIGSYGLPTGLSGHLSCQGVGGDRRADPRCLPAPRVARATGDRGGGRRWRQAGHPQRGCPLSRIRIIGGEWRSRLIDVGTVKGLRPTPDRCGKPCSTGWGRSSMEKPVSICLLAVAPWASRLPPAALLR
jgi:hypothetical protein